MNETCNDHYWMSLAYEQAEKAGQSGEVPVGAVLVRDQTLIARGYNSPIASCDPSAHAEVNAIRMASQKAANYRLPGSTLYVTLEPCTMCFGLLVHARVARLVYGASEPKAGVIKSQLQLSEQGFYNHRIEVREGVLAEQCSALLSGFFQSRRNG